jgi:hypothetical protein
MDVLERNALESAGANWEKTKFGQTYDNFGERGTRILTAIKDRLLKRYPKSQDRNRILEQLGIDL